MERNPALWLLLALLLSKLAGEQEGSMLLVGQARTRLAKAAVAFFPLRFISM